MDVQRCNLVFQFDEIQQFRSYVQSKGRARAKPSRYVRKLTLLLGALLTIAIEHLDLPCTIALTMINFVLQVHCYGRRKRGSSLACRSGKGNPLRIRDCQGIFLFSVIKKKDSSNLKWLECLTLMTGEGYNPIWFVINKLCFTELILLSYISLEIVPPNRGNVYQQLPS